MWTFLISLSFAQFGLSLKTKQNCNIIGYAHDRITYFIQSNDGQKNVTLLLGETVEISGAKIPPPPNPPSPPNPQSLEGGGGGVNPREDINSKN